ncbi:uncharacterized protein LOC129608224 [Condylostylus longicornis]|uniref:uncharacterized protein LOC129608224 n=1 Tax=Condylostylus longicornis TaxID=2530218 RepID=UPI00244E3FAC|nr:uncharacterized protein LOC129608224 [Condylostylus longicornis]
MQVLWIDHHSYSEDGILQQKHNSFIPETDSKSYSLLQKHNYSSISNINFNENMAKLGGAAYYGYTNISVNHVFELSPLLPFGMLLIISLVICVLILFRRWPGIVAGIIAGCLTSLSIYLMLVTLRNPKLLYE